MRLRFSLFLLLALPALAAAQTGGVRGTAVIKDKDLPLHQAKVLVVQLGRSVTTNDDGSFELRDLPLGQFDVVASFPGLSSDMKSVTIVAGEIATVEFALGLSPLKQEITVTASGAEQTAFESFQAVSTLDSFELSEKGASTLGEVLDTQPGVAKRSFGPGASRPIIRGFDGDRVLVLQDGVRTGSLASQSGDHGEPIDVLGLERLEVVKGPATLLYGSNAVGGVVNAVSGHHRMKEGSTDGLRGYLTGGIGSANRTGLGGLGFEYGARNWVMWGGASNQKTGDYQTPVGSILNSGSRLSTGTGGVGWYTDRSYAAVNYSHNDGIYGIPADAADDHVTKLDFRRKNVRFSGAHRNLGPAIDGVRVDFNFSSWYHQELEVAGDEVEVGTTFDNKQYTYQVMFDQKRRGRWSGTLGFFGLHRDYKPVGDEAIAPSTTQNVAAALGLQQFKFEKFELQVGGRLESTRYTPEGATNRRFTGASGAVGAHLDLWNGGALVANFTHSYRAPALEELYNNGPHPGNLSFEIGDEDLKRERSNGFDFSLRHIADRFRVEANAFAYYIDDFVYLAPTGRERDDLDEAVYSQGDTQYTGTELGLDYELVPGLWVNGGLDYVRAELRQNGAPLPRIPPLRGRFGFDARWKGLSIKPELAMANHQERLFDHETRTSGYTVVNLAATYTVPTQHASHHFGVSAFNLGDRLYRNHVSFIKDIAPEIGRGVRFTYSIRFF